MKKIIFLTLLCSGLLLTACGQNSEIPPVQLIEVPTPIITTTPPIPPPTEPETTPELIEETPPPEISIEETQPEIIETTLPIETETVFTTTTTTTATTTTTINAETQTETTTEAKPKYTPWVRAYRSVLAQYCREKQQKLMAETTEPLPTDEDDSEEYDTPKKKTTETEELDNQWFVLIYLNDDTIPELVILDESDMELYCFDGKTTQLLLEDSYKSDALEGQNVCYQPYSGYIASAFTTMSGGDGFTIYHFDELDAVHVQRYYFNNNENTEGEMAYNEIWDSAEEFEVIDNGYHDVTLGESWTHITSEMDGAYRLSFESANELSADSAPVVEYPTEPQQDPTEETQEEE